MKSDLPARRTVIPERAQAEEKAAPAASEEEQGSTVLSSAEVSDCQ